MLVAFAFTINESVKTGYYSAIEGKVWVLQGFRLC